MRKWLWQWLSRKRLEEAERCAKMADWYSQEELKQRDDAARFKNWAAR